MSASAFAITDVTVAILSGGQGMRVGGQDKGLMRLADKPLVAWVCERVRGQGGALLICANRHAQDYAKYGTVVADAAPGFFGPLAGIAAALHASTTPWLVTVPVDCPRPPAYLAQRLCAAAESSDANVAVARRGEKREPIFAIYRGALAESASAGVYANKSVRGWQDDCDAVEVDFSDCVEAFVNLNTPEDFRRWEEQHDG
jgi:molybdopterin-guanine dinucleotide biosynthesis protein A